MPKICSMYESDTYSVFKLSVSATVCHFRHTHCSTLFKIGFTRSKFGSTLCVKREPNFKANK